MDRKKQYGGVVLASNHSPIGSKTTNSRTTVTTDQVELLITRGKRRGQVWHHTDPKST